MNVDSVPQTRAPRQARKVTLATLTDGKLALWIAQGDDLQAYLLTPIPSDWGVAYRVAKANRGAGQPEAYDVLLAGRESSCTCKGHTFCGHCRHVESLTALIAAGKLAAPQRQQPAPARQVRDRCGACDQPYADCRCSI